MPRRKLDEWFWQIDPDLGRAGELTRVRPSVASGRCWEPRVDVMDVDDRVIVRIELAGVRAEEVGLVYNPERHSLMVRGIRHEEIEETEQAAFYQLEVPFGPFEREVRLPRVVIQPEGIRARYRNGFLIVMIPKADEVIVTTVTIKEIP